VPEAGIQKGIVH